MSVVCDVRAAKVPAYICVGVQPVVEVVVEERQVYNITLLAPPRPAPPLTLQLTTGCHRANTISHTTYTPSVRADRTEQRVRKRRSLLF